MIISCNLICNWTRYLKNTLLRFAHILTYIIHFTAAGIKNFVKNKNKKSSWIEHSQICMQQLKISFFSTSNPYKSTFVSEKFSKKGGTAPPVAKVLVAPLQTIMCCGIYLPVSIVHRSGGKQSVYSFFPTFLLKKTMLINTAN